MTANPGGWATPPEQKRDDSERLAWDKATSRISQGGAPDLRGCRELYVERRLLQTISLRISTLNLLLAVASEEQHTGAVAVAASTGDAVRKAAIELDELASLIRSLSAVNRLSESTEELCTVNAAAQQVATVLRSALKSLNCVVTLSLNCDSIFLCPQNRVASTLLSVVQRLLNLRPPGAGSRETLAIRTASEREAVTIAVAFGTTGDAERHVKCIDFISPPDSHTHSGRLSDPEYNAQSGRDLGVQIRVTRVDNGTAVAWLRLDTSRLLHASERFHG